MKYASDKNDLMPKDVAHNEWITGQYQLTDVGGLRRSPHAWKSCQLLNRTENFVKDPVGPSIANQGGVIFMNPVQVAICFLTQFYLRHGLPTWL